MRSVIWSIAPMAMCALTSCSAETPATRPNEADLERVNQCSMHVSGLGNADLKGQDLQRALTLLQHCLSIPRNKTIEDFRVERDLRSPYYTFYFESTDSGEPKQLYAILHYGDGSRLMCVGGAACKEKAFIADDTTLKMADDLVETARRTTVKDQARQDKEFRQEFRGHP
ncbi:MAG: hypothetical protein IMZ44_07370 [Planctomycetes bacterium]|nr:hypothetical protein [Planctomycetota bacterium]